MHGLALALSAIVLSNISIPSDDRELHKTLLETSALGGTNYIAARNHLVTSCSNSVVDLKSIAANTNESWKIRIMAGIVAERIERGSEIEELIRTDWTKDPEYKKEWEVKLAGSAREMGPIISGRYRDKGLWWYCLEMVWKNTDERSRRPRISRVDWRGICKIACVDSPVFDLLVKILEENVRNDLDLKNYQNEMDFVFLLRTKKNIVLPVALEVIPRVKRDYQDDYYTQVIETVAAPSDYPMIEKHIKEQEAKTGKEFTPSVHRVLNGLKQKWTDKQAKGEQGKPASVQ